MSGVRTNRTLGCCNACSTAAPERLGYRRTLGRIRSRRLGDFDWGSFAVNESKIVAGLVATKLSQPKVVYQVTQSQAPLASAPQPPVNRGGVVPPSSSDMFAGLTTKDLMIGGVAVAALLIAASAGRR